MLGIFLNETSMTFSNNFISHSRFYEGACEYFYDFTNQYCFDFFRAFPKLVALSLITQASP